MKKNYVVLISTITLALFIPKIFLDFSFSPWIFFYHNLRHVSHQILMFQVSIVTYTKYKKKKKIQGPKA